MELNLFQLPSLFSSPSWGLTRGEYEAVGEQLGELGEYFGELGEQVGLDGVYCGDVGEYCGEVGEQCGDVVERCDAPPLVPLVDGTLRAGDAGE